jgi:hypothetical protein
MDSFRRIVLDENRDEEFFQQHMKQSEKKLKVVVVLIALLFIFCLWYMLSE